MGYGSGYGLWAGGAGLGIGPLSLPWLPSTSVLRTHISTSSPAWLPQTHIWARLPSPSCCLNPELLAENVCRGGTLYCVQYLPSPTQSICLSPDQRLCPLKTYIPPKNGPLPPDTCPNPASRQCQISLHCDLHTARQLPSSELELVLCHMQLLDMGWPCLPTLQGGSESC